jgi:uncharacterized protein (DUF433 family)
VQRKERPPNHKNRCIRLAAAERRRKSPQSGPGATISVMIDWSSCPAVERDPERVSGAWVFRGTRVPVAALFENLEDGVSIGEVVVLFPGISLNQARAVLEHAARSALAPA